MWKPILRFRRLFILILVSGIFIAKPSYADTQKHQFQLGTGVGVFVGTDNLDASFDIDVEPEFFLTKHLSLSGRFDGMIGGTDGVHFGSRLRYYFNIPNHSRFSIYVGGGAGFMLAFDNNDTHAFGDFAVPVFGFQYDLSEHVKIGSDISFDIIFNGDDAAFATRIQVVQFKWAF